MTPQRKVRLCLLLCGAFLLSAPRSASALPAFARQSGMECWACHVGSFGPQLTPIGRMFKLNGYQLGALSPLQKLKNAVSGLLQGGFVHTQKDQPAGATPYNTNNNLAVEQASLFFAGHMARHLGVFSQATYDGVNDRLGWDNVDIRYTRTLRFAAGPLLLAADANNAPSVQDAWQTTPVWRFPFLTSSLMPAPAAAPFIDKLAQRTVGAGAYGMWNDTFYLGLFGYTQLPDAMARDVGVEDVSTADHIDGVAPYWRAVVHFPNASGLDYFSLGTYGMAEKRYPGNIRTAGTDNLLDTAVDATYQVITPDDTQDVSLYASYLHERQELGASAALGQAANTHDSLNSFSASASYYYEHKYGLTVSRFDITGSADAKLYAANTSHTPDSTGWTFQADYTPFGHTDSPFFPYLNARFFVQYTLYNKFDGAAKNYDGTGRSAADNNTLYTGVWMEF